MARYIDADKLCENLKTMAKYQEPYKQSTILGVVSTIENTPTADVEEVKHGEWEQPSYSLYRVNCSLCGSEHYVGAFYQYKMNYCPNCGAKMDGVQGK